MPDQPDMDPELSAKFAAFEYRREVIASLIAALPVFYFLLERADEALRERLVRIVKQHEEEFLKILLAKLANVDAEARQEVLRLLYTEVARAARDAL